MIIITDIQYVRVDTDRYLLTKAYLGDTHLTTTEVPYAPLEVTEEMIHGIEIQRADGERYLLGISAEASKVFAAAEETFTLLQKDRKHFKKLLDEALHWQNKVTRANWVTRLRWLVTGVRVQ